MAAKNGTGKTASPRNGAGKTASPGRPPARDEDVRLARAVLHGFVIAQRDRALRRKLHSFETALTSSSAFEELRSIRKVLRGRGRWDPVAESFYRVLVA